MIKKIFADIYFSRLAKKKIKLEDKGKFHEAGKIDIKLEENNRCLCCGGEQYFDEAYYKRTGIWACRKCNG